MAKFTKETKIGLLAVVALALGIWGFKFLKGINVLDRSQTFYVRYANVDQLRPSSPVMINGLEVGMISEMYIDPEDGHTVVAVLDIEKKVLVPKTTVATIVGTGLMGGKAIELVYTVPCSGPDCAESGATLQGTNESFLESMLGDPNELDQYMDRFRLGLSTFYDSVANPADPKGFGRTLVSLEEAMQNMAILTNKMNRLVEASTVGISATASNAAEITGAIRANNRNIEAALANLATVTEQLKNARFDQAGQKAGQALDSIGVALSSMNSALQTAEHAVAGIDSLVASLANKDGFIGQLANDQELYINLVRTSRHLHLLLQDFRLNPRRYNTVKLKLFGGKNVKKYEVPEDDPAYLLELDSLEREYSRRMDSVEVVKPSPYKVKG